MTSKTSRATGHSSIVHMSLILGATRHRITHLGGDYFILADSFSSTPVDAEILVTVDGVEDRSPVHLPDGISPKSRRTRIERAKTPLVASSNEMPALANLASSFVSGTDREPRI